MSVQPFSLYKRLRSWLHHFALLSLNHCPFQSLRRRSEVKARTSSVFSFLSSLSPSPSDSLTEITRLHRTRIIVHKLWVCYLQGPILLIPDLLPTSKRNRFGNSTRSCF